MKTVNLLKMLAMSIRKAPRPYFPRLASSNQPRAAGAVALALALAFTSPAHAGDVPSCYAANQIPLPSVERAIFVLIDQTTLLNDSLRRSVMSNVGRFMQPGTSFTVSTFSSFAQGRFMEITAAGDLEPALEDDVRNGVKVKRLADFNACMRGQRRYALQFEADALTRAMDGVSATLLHSDVQASISALSDVVRASTAKDRVVLIVSDMLENSSVSNFYAQQNVRKVDVLKEMALSKASGMIGDFDGARVYVMGAGLVPEPAKGKGIYRDPRTMNALRAFWVAYFKASNADLAGFGQPALLTAVK